MRGWLFIFCVPLLGACSCDDEPAASNNPGPVTPNTPVMPMAASGPETTPVAGEEPTTVTEPATDPGPGAVPCGDAVCDYVPDFVVDLGGLACCNESLQCGVHIPNNPVFQDVCVPVMAPGDPSFDCMTQFDPMLNAFRYGCCLPNGTCGEEPLMGNQFFGCVDITIAGFENGGPCSQDHPCKRHDTPCADASECCPLSERGALCVDSQGTGTNVCSLHCDQDGDCPTLCCRPTPTGENACVPVSVCEGS